MQERYYLYSFLFILLIASGAFFCKKSSGLDDVGIGGDFVLTEAGGKDWKFSENAKDINLVFFGYTACPDFCPMTLSKLKRVNQLLGKDSERVQIVFISVDSLRDKPENLKEYVNFYVPNGVGLVGSKSSIDEIAKLYGASYSQNGEFIDHSTYTYLLDKDLKTRYLFRHADTEAKLVEIIKLLL